MKRTLLLLIIILGVAFRIWVSQPTWIHWDENYYINIFQNYVDRGELTPYMWRLGADTRIIAGSGTGYGIYVLIGWMLVFGESLFGLRMLMVLAGLITAWLYYLISKKWWESKEAGIAAMVFGLVSTSSFYTLVGRMDAIGILTYSLLLLLHITAVRQEKKWPHFWVGVVSILTVEFHILGLLYLGALAGYYGFQYIQILKRERKPVLNVYPVYFFFGAGLLGFIYILVHIFPDPESYFIISNTCPYCFSRVKNEVYRIIFLLMFRPQELILVLLIIYFSLRNKGQTQHFLVLFFGYGFTQLVLSPPPNIQYYHHLIPLISIGLAKLVTYAISQVRAEQQSLLRTVFLLAALVLLSLNPLLYFYSEWEPYEFTHRLEETEEVNYIQEFIPKSTVVMSTASNFYQLREYRNFLQFGPNLNYGLSIRGEEMADFMNRINPEVIYLPPEYIDDDPIVQQFLANKDFAMLTPELWVARGLIPTE